PAVSEIQFTWKSTGNEGAGELEITVDGQPLANWIRDVEMPFAQAEDPENGECIAGAYAGLTDSACPDDLVAHFLGCGSSSADGKTVLLGCNCGVVGCWPLMARIETRTDTVRWVDFEQPHRRGRWSYAAATPLVFDRA